MTAKEFLLQLLKSGIQLSQEKLRQLFEIEEGTELIAAYLKRNPLQPWDNSQLLLFGRPDSPKLVLSYIKSRHGFNPELEYKLFELLNAEEVITAYVAKHPLYSNLAQLKLFAFPSAEDILIIYIENGHQLNAQAQLKLFDLPNAEKMVKLYAKYNFNLSKEFKRLLHKKGWHKN